MQAAPANLPRRRHADFRFCVPGRDRSARASAATRTKVRLARLEWPIDAKIAWYPGFWHPADQVNERWREQRRMALVGERELDPADQQGRNGDLGRLPWPGSAVGLHEQGRRQFAVPDPRWPGADREPVAVALPRPLARVTPGGVVRRSTNLDDRLHPPHGHVQPRRPTRELVDLALMAVSRPCPPPACAKPNGAAHGFHRKLDPCDRPPGRTDPAMLVLAPARSRSCPSASGGTRAPDLARLRSGAKLNAGCPGQHIKANRCRGRAARVGGAIPMHSRSGKCGLSRNQAAEGLELSTVCSLLLRLEHFRGEHGLGAGDLERFDALAEPQWVRPAIVAEPSSRQVTSRLVDSVGIRCYVRAVGIATIRSDIRTA
jgi:hypothetical protein